MEKYTGLIPHIVVKNGPAAMDFYKAGLGAVETSRMPADDGKRLMHASMTVEGCTFFLCDDFPEYCNGQVRAPKDGVEGPISLHVVVKDADAAIEKAVKAGAAVKMPAADMFWGDRYGQITDPFGHTWSFSHPLSAEATAAAAKAWVAMKAQWK